VVCFSLIQIKLPIVYNVPATIPAALDEAAAQCPGHEAVVDGDVRLSFAELRDEARRVAAALVAAGIEPGDRVALWAPNGAAWIVASFGVYAAGGVLVPLNTRYRGDEAGHILRTSGARLLITVGDFLGADYAAMLDGVEGLDALERTVHLDTDAWPAFLAAGGTVDAAEVDERIAAIDEDDTSDIIFTSGTTGAPKGAMLTHGASVRTYLSWSELVDLREGDRYLCVYPFFHTAGLKSGILACVLRRAAIYPQPTFDVPTVLDLVGKERITMLPGPPTVFQTIINHPELQTFDLSSVRSSVTGAAVVPVETIRQMREVLGIRTVVTGYGMTETTGTISMCRFDDPPEVIAQTVGRPIPGVEVRIAEDGEILVRGFNVMQGYFGNPEATAETIVDGWLHTGDIGQFDDGGNLRITDRKKDMFIVGGFNAYPAEIEAVLLGHPAVAQVAVVGAPDERMGERGVAFVLPKADAALDPDEVLTWAWERLAKFKLSEVRVVDGLPLNPTGKVQKFKLRELLG
jgi:acyl-CoA synthetase (AMP-forming)/AMP-acid ligase II